MTANAKIDRTEKVQGMHHMVAYGIRTARDPEAEEKARDRWGRAHNVGMLLCCREEAKTSREGVERRPQLHLALSCLRSGDAQVLWVPDLSVFGDQIAQALACAEAWSTGAIIVASGEVVTAELRTPLQQFSWSYVRLADQHDPRQTEPDDPLDPDIGEYNGDQQCARKAQKLLSDYRLNLDEAATYMNKTRYIPEAGGTWSGPSIHALLGRHRVSRGPRSEEVLTKNRMAALTSLALATIGPDAEELKTAAIAYNDGLSRPFDHVLPFTVNHRQDDPESPGASDLERQILLLLGFATKTPLVGCVYASTEDAFGETAAVRELVYAHCLREGIAIVIGGEPFDREAVVDEQTRVLRDAAWSAVCLRLVLRAHDAGSVRYDSGLPVA